MWRLFLGTGSKVQQFLNVDSLSRFKMVNGQLAAGNRTGFVKGHGFRMRHFFQDAASLNDDPAA